MADFGAGIVMQNIGLRQQGDRDIHNELYNWAGMAQHRREFDETMEYNKSKPDPFSLGKTVDQALLKHASGQPLTPQEQAAVKAYDMKNAGQPTYTTDASGRVIAGPPRPSLYDQLNPQSSRAEAGALTPGINPNEPHPMDAPMGTFDMLGGMLPPGEGPPMDDFLNAAVLGDPSLLTPANNLPQMPVDDYYATGPKAQDRRDEANVEVMRDAAKLPITEREERIKTDEQIRKEKELSAMKRQEATPQEELALKSTIQEAKDINSTIKKLYDNASFMNTGFIGDKTKGIAGTPAGDFAQNLKTLESDAGLSKLIEVKERGGTFGALQEKELDLLINSRAALAQSQSPDAFKKNLIEYQERRNRAIPLLAEAFQQKHGYLPEGVQESLASLGEGGIKRQIKDGTTAVNPQTGERIIFTSGQWRSI